MKPLFKEAWAFTACLSLVLTTTSWPRIKAAAALVVDVVANIRPGDYRELRIP